MRRRRLSRATAAFLLCPLAAVTVPWILNGGGAFPAREVVLPYLRMGALLGVARLLLRPLLRLIFAPFGFIGFGLSGTAVDIALIYLCTTYVEALPGMSFLCAALTALTINICCLIVSGRE